MFAALAGGAGGRLAQAEFRGIVEDIVVTEIGPSEVQVTMTAMLSGALPAGIRRWIDAGAKGAGAEINEAFDLLLAAVPR